mgnify:FL=1
MAHRQTETKQNRAGEGRALRGRTSSAPATARVGKAGGVPALELEQETVGGPMRRCIQCSERIFPQRSTRLFCGVTCRVAYYRAQQSHPAGIAKNPGGQESPPLQF